jgi:hypothetical protein
MHDGIPRANQRSQNGKCLIGQKHERALFEFCEYLSGSHFCRKDPGWYPKGQPKKRKWKMSDGEKNISDFYLSFAHTSHDHTFTTRINDGIPKKRQRIENGKCSMGKKIKDF